MKNLFAPVLALVLAVSAFAQGGATSAMSPPAGEKAISVAPVIPASVAEVSAPLVLKDGAISQLQQTELAAGGKATFNFTVEQDGDYLVHAVVDAPAEDANSFFLNIDAPPQSPLMIWDMDVTNGFEERIVSWRGNGDASSDEFTPKVFKLTAGSHKLFLVGREPTQLKSVSVRPAPVRKR